MVGKPLEINTLDIIGFSPQIKIFFDQMSKTLKMLNKSI